TAADITVTGAAPVTITAATAGVNGGQIIMANGTVVNAGAGAITLDADGNISLGQLITTNNTAGAVSITSDNGALVEVGDAGGVDIIANGLAAVTTITTATGIGAAADPIQTQVSILNASVTAGNIVIEETDAINLIDVDTGTGNIDIQAGGAITATDVQIAGKGIGKYIDLTSTGAGIAVGLVGIDAADANGGGSGSIILDAQAGSITDLNADAAADIISKNGKATLTATGSIGTGIGSLAAINTRVGTLVASTTTLGDINIWEADDVTLESLTTTSGDIYVRAVNGDITVETVAAGGVSAGKAGDVTIYALGANKSIFDDGDPLTFIAGGGTTSGVGSGGASLDIQAAEHVGGTASDISAIDPTDVNDAKRALDIDASTFSSISVSSAQDAGTTGNIQLYDTDSFDISTLTLNVGGSNNQIYLGAGTSMNLNGVFSVGANDLALALYNPAGTLTIGSSGQAAATGGHMVEVYSSGDVALGGSNVGGAISTPAGSVNITAKGSIKELVVDAIVDISAATGSVTLVANDGIGTGSNANAAIDIVACNIWAENGVSDNPGPGAGNLGVFLNVLNGVTPVNIQEAFAWHAGNVWIQADTDTLTLTDVRAENSAGDVTALIAGGVGDVVAVSVQAGSDVSITAGTTAPDNIYVDYVNAGGSVDLTATAGNILENGTDGSADIIAVGTTTLTASGNIGTTGNAIETTIGALVANSTTAGDIVL
ncbi:MAG: hypothetical protein JEZ11_28545, partial [Desulfobacterales bacterium]|nr:hypothetical protein [Desulfobacterales bacterium]